MMMPCAAGERTLEEAGGERVELLLARRVPDLHLQLGAGDLEVLDLEVDRDGREVPVRELALVELLQHAGLAHARLADEQHLHQVVVGLR